MVKLMFYRDHPAPAAEQEPHWLVSTGIAIGRNRHAQTAQPPVDGRSGACRSRPSLRRPERRRPQTPGHARNQPERPARPKSRRAAAHQRSHAAAIARWQYRQPAAPRPGRRPAHATVYPPAAANAPSHHPGADALLSPAGVKLKPAQGGARQKARTRQRKSPVR